MNESWLKKASWLVGIFLFVLVFNLNKNQVYESETDILLLPKSQVIALNLDATVGNFQQILASLAFNDRLSEGSEALAPGVELPNYKRKEFWNSKLAVIRASESSIIRIKNFDADRSLAQELNNDTVENLIAVAGNYYNIKTDLELRIVDGPTVKKVTSQNLVLTIGESLLWAIGLYLVLFFIFPLIFIRKETKRREMPGRDFNQKRESLKKTMPTILPEEENYFATRNFFSATKKIAEEQELEKLSVEKKELTPKNAFYFPNFPSFGKKAPTPSNLPVSDEEVPDIFRQKTIAPEIVEDLGEPGQKTEAVGEEYVPREATPEEVKARLNRLLGGGK